MQDGAHAVATAAGRRGAYCSRLAWRRCLTRHAGSRFWRIDLTVGNDRIAPETRLKRELGVEVAHLDFYTLAPEVVKEYVVSEVWGHACKIEVSMSMYLAPHIVKTDQLTKGDIKGYPYVLNPGGGSRKIGYAYNFDDITANGCTGDATHATRDIGEATVEKCLERAAEFLEDYMR